MCPESRRRRRTQRVIISGHDSHGIGMAQVPNRIYNMREPRVLQSNFSLFLSTTSPTTDFNSSRTARSTPVLVIRPPAQPPLTERDWEPPSALGVCSPEGFKSEQSISQLRPYTPSPSVSTFASSSITNSTVATPTADALAQPEAAQVLDRVSQALFLHAQQSNESLTSESVYSDTNTAPETFDAVQPEDDKPEPEKIPEIDLESKAIGVPSEQVLSDSAVESLQVERPLSPVGVGLAASSASTVSRDRNKPTIRPSLLGFFSRWADKRPPSGKDPKDKQLGPISFTQGTGVQHESSVSGSTFTRLRNKSTERLAALLAVGEDIKPSSSSIRSSRFKIGHRKTNSGSVQTGERTDSGVTQATPQAAAHLAPPSSPPPEAGAGPATDVDPLAEEGSVRSSERGRAIESRSSAGTPCKPLPARSPSEEPIGGEPVLISGQPQTELQSDPELDPVLSEPVQQPTAETASKDLPTLPRSRSPSLFRKKLRDKRARTRSLRDLLKRSDSTKSKKQERITPPTPFIAWITQHTHRSPPSEPPLPAVPTLLATPHLSLPPENLSPVVETSPTDTSRILSLVWYPPELIRSPYASDISLSENPTNYPNPAAPFDERESGISARLSGLLEPTDETASQTDSHPFYLQPPFSGVTNPIANISSSTVHAQSTPERKSPAKLRRKHRPGNKTHRPRTPPTSYSALSRKQSRGRHESTESIAGSSIGPTSTAPSRSLDTLLNSSWPEPPVHPLKSDDEEQTYHYLTETGVEDDSDREEYLPSPTSIGGASTRPTTPKRLRARSRSRSPGDAIRDERPFPAGIHDDQSDWEPSSRVTSYMSASPSTARSPASPGVKAPPVPPLPQHIVPRARQRTGSTNAARSGGIFDNLPLRPPSPDHRFTAVTPTPPPRSLSETSPARPPPRTSSPSPTRASSTPRASSPMPPFDIPPGTPILHSAALPRRTTSYQSAASMLSSDPHEPIDESHSTHPTLDDGRSLATVSISKRRSPTQGRKDLHSTSRRDSGQYRRSRKDSNRSHRESIKSHRDSLALRKDVLQAHKRDSIHSLQLRDSINSQHKYQADNQIWVVPRNHRQRPTITFEFPPTNEFWQFLNEYQQYIGPGTARGEDSEHGPTGNDMAEPRSGSATSGSSRSSKPKVDPVKDWHKVQPSSSRTSSSRASIDRTGTHYVPTPDVIERNELIIKALKNAPGALHTRFRHFGQLGVLGWSSEFSELIDEIQRCGLERQMFTTTRAQALSTCKALLKLHIDIRLQMISMFLCSQIGRLRRFLDGETEYTDYPTPDFPLPEAY